MVRLTGAQPPTPRSPAQRCEDAFPSDAHAPGRARAFLREAAIGWQLPGDVIDDALVVVSEMTANAVTHARTPVVLSLIYDGHTLLITTADGAPAVPTPRDAPETAEDGRGLALIAALATSHGVQLTPLGKVTWASIALRPPASRGHL